MTALIILVLLIFLYPLLYWVWGENEDSNERIRKDEKYSFKKMNAEINKRKETDKSK